MTSISRNQSVQEQYHPSLEDHGYNFAAWERLPVDDVDSDWPSFVAHDSFFSASSRSTVPGPGAIAGKFLKIIGEKSLDLVVGMIIRRHLSSIGSLVENKSGVFYNPFGEEEWKIVIRAYKDLHELCRESRREYYPLSLQRTAANLILDITARIWHTRSDHARASRTIAKWEALLYFVWTRRREDLLRELSTLTKLQSPEAFPAVGPVIQRTQSHEMFELRRTIMRVQDQRRRSRPITFRSSSSESPRYLRRKFQVRNYVSTEVDGPVSKSWMK